MLCRIPRRFVSTPSRSNCSPDGRSAWKLQRTAQQIIRYRLIVIWYLIMNRRIPWETPIETPLINHPPKLSAPHLQHDRLELVHRHGFSRNQLETIGYKLSSVIPESIHRKKSWEWPGPQVWIIVSMEKKGYGTAGALKNGFFTSISCDRHRYPCTKPRA